MCALRILVLWFNSLLFNDLKPDLLHMFLHFCNQAPSDADLKEHMVGIIFSRSKLTNLQKQVNSKFP